MANLKDLSISDVKVALDFTSEEIKKQKSKDIDNGTTIRLLEEQKEKLRQHLFYRVNALKQYE